MRITIPDDLADQYQSIATKLNLPLDEVVSRQLSRTVSVLPQGRQVVLGQTTLEYLERRCGGGVIQTSADVEARVGRLASISFMGQDLRLSPGQLEELAHRADRQGKPIATLITEIAETLVRDFFYASGGGMTVEAAQAVPKRVIPGTSPLGKSAPSLDGLAGGTQ